MKMSHHLPAASTHMHHAAAAAVAPPPPSGAAPMNHVPVSSGQQLLFFDTFSHDLEAELNLDLVQFPQPVVVEEVRVIPLGARVEANFPGGVRLGATNPKKFQLDFYVNALGKPGAPTFQSLGTLHYNDSERINLAMNKSIATDGLLVLGMYNTITLAVYGALTQDTAEQLAARGSAASAPSTPAAAAVAAADAGELQRPPPSVAPPAAAVALNHNSKRHPPPAPQPSATAHDEQWYARPHPPTVPPQQQQQQSHHPLPLPTLQQPPPAVPWTSGDRFDHPPPQQPAPLHHMRHPGALNGSSAVHPEDQVLHHAALPHPHPHSHPHHIPPPSHHLHPPPPNHHRGGPPPPQLPPQVEMNHHHPSQSQQQQQQQQPRRLQHHQRHERSSSRDYNSGGGGRGRESRSPPRRSRSPSLPIHEFQEKNLVERNCKRTGGNSAAVKQTESAPPPPENDILEDVSDISDGDIPDVPTEEEKAKDKAAQFADRNEVKTTAYEQNEVKHDAAREVDASPGLVEEISEEEADWSDDGGILDMDLDFGEDWEDPIKVFDPYQAELAPLILPRRMTELNFRTCDVEATVVAPLNQEWIEQIESFSAEMFEHCGVVDLDEGMRNALLSLADIALSIDKAMEQEVPTMKVRHIKSGIAFAKTVFALERKLAHRLLNSGVQSKAMRIFEAEHMATSISLSVAAFLDDTLDTKLGYDILVGARATSGCETNGENIYGTLLSAYASASTRTKASLSALLGKISVFETAQKLRTLCVNIISTQMDEERSNEININEEELVAIIECLIEAIRTAPQVMSHPKRYLPVRFEPEPGQKSGYKSILRIFEESNLLQSIQLILSLPTASSMLTAACQLLFQEVLQVPGGISFFAGNHKTTNELIRLLVYGGVEDQSVGMRLCCCTYAEQAMSKVAHGASDDLAGVVDSCQNLHSMIFFAAGQQFLVETLFTSTHLRAVVDFLSCPGIEDDLENVMQTTAKGFLKDILLLVFRRQPPHGPKERYSDLEKIFLEIVELAEKEEPGSSFRRIVALTRPYLDVLNADVKKLTEVTQKNAQNVNPVTKELLAAVRTLACRMNQKDISGGYKFLCQEIYSSGITDSFVSILTKICSHHEQPSLHMATFASGDTGFDLFSLILSIVCVLENIFRHLVVARDSEFKDSGPIGTLIKVHSLLCAVQPSSPYNWITLAAAQGVRNILCLYTKPTFDATTRKVSGSLWTIVASEVIEFTCALPHQFSPGLKLLSELLPLPLPLQTKMRLGINTEGIVKARKLWSAHLFPLSSQIRTMFRRITPVCDQTLSQTLRRTSIQLIDLSAPVAEMACEVILDCLDHLDPVNSARICGFVSSLVEYSESAKMAFVFLFEEKKRPNFQTICDLLHKPGRPYHQARFSVATLLQSLCDPEISLAGSDLANSEDYLKQSIPSHSLLDVILEACAQHLALSAGADGLALDDAVSAAATATVIRTIGMLCEHDYGFARVKACMSTHHTGFFAAVLEALLDHDLASSDCLSSMLLVAQALYTLPNDQSDYVKPRTLALERGQVLALLSAPDETAESEEGEEPRKRLLERLLETFERVDKGDELKKLGVEVASTLLEEAKLLPDEERECTSAPEPVQVAAGLTLADAYRDREICSFSDFAPKLSAVDWLADFAAAEEAPQQTPVTFCTASRRVDLTEISRESLSKEFDLAEQMRVVCEEKGLLDERPKEGEADGGGGGGGGGKAPLVSPAKRKGFSTARKSILERRAAQSKNIISNFRSSGGGSGRGGHRGHQNFHHHHGHHHSRSDGFRSRPPNTSRPPSLHVDDFMLLQARGQQPTGPTGYNKQSIKAAKELFAEREAAAVAHQQKAAMGASSVVGFREATKEPVYSYPDNNGLGRGGGGGASGMRGGGRGGGGGGRRGWKSWSPDVGGGGGGRFPARRGGGGGGPWRGFRERSKFGDRLRYPR